MPSIINTNIASLNAQRNLNRTGGQLETSLQRLSTGLRINSAKDDAAGLAISERFTTQIRGLNQAIRNANDGISFAQTAEGALSTVGDSLQRIRELAVQAANDSNSLSDRQALNDEVEQLVAEVNRIALTTEFNGGRVLDGSQTELFFQVGANQGQTIAVDGVDSRTTQLGSQQAVGALGLTQSQINDDGIASITNVVVDVTSNPLTTAITADMTGVTTLEDAVRVINSEIAARAAAGDADAQIIQDSELSASLRVNNDGTTTLALNSAFDAATSMTGGDVTLADTGATVVAGVGTGVSDVIDLTEINVTSRFSAAETIGAVDTALTQVNSLRAELGSVQTRFESTISNLAVTSENLSAARSRIRDADFAAETAELTRTQILQQAGVSILAQANVLPQSALALLQ